MEARILMIKRYKIEILLYICIYVLVILFLILNQDKIDQYITYGNESTKQYINIISVIAGVIILFRLKSIYLNNKK